MRVLVVLFVVFVVVHIPGCERVLAQTDEDDQVANSTNSTSLQDDDESLNSQNEDNNGDIHDEPLSEIDFYNGNLIDIEEPSTDPLTIAGLFEGDIAIANDSFDVLGGRNAIIGAEKLWPNNEIPYTVTGFNSYERSVIARAISSYHSHTCIRFVPWSRQRDYVNFVKGKGCSSVVGRQGGKQQLSLGHGCIYFGIAIHEMMHAVGFWHEQSREDRDNYITILWDNIIPGMAYNFQKYSWNYIQSLGERYDLGSIMHYETYAFSTQRGLPTIVPKNRNAGTIGQRKGFSNVDIRKINKLYNCKASVTLKSGKSSGKVTTTTNLNCRDSHVRCAEWASNGDCNSNYAFMKVNCMKSCNTCEGTEFECTNSNYKCPAWAQKGECDANPKYMLAFCKKSCGVC